MRWMRWLVAVIATMAVFGLCLWLFRFASWSWIPHATSDRWAVAAAFAWSPPVRSVRPAPGGQARGPTIAQRTGRRINQSARASCHSMITQVGGDQHTTGT